MGLKKRSGVSAEFSLASATDVIFLLLLFFMLTSTLVKIQPFDLPTQDHPFKELRDGQVHIAIPESAEGTCRCRVA